MAIVIEEQQNKSGATIVASGIIVLALLGFGAYYIFWKSPRFAEVAIPPAFQNTKQLIDLGGEVHPENVLQSIEQTLQRHVQPTVPQNLGRANPFLGF